MNRKLTLYSRKDCCLCDEMKSVVAKVALKIPLEVEIIDVDSAEGLREKFGDEVPVLFVNGRKAFKYRATVKDLEKLLNKNDRPWISRLRFGARGG